MNPVVRRDVAVTELLSSIGGDAFPERRKLLVDLLDIDESWHMHAVSDGPKAREFLADSRRTTSCTISHGFDETLDNPFTRRSHSGLGRPRAF